MSPKKMKLTKGEYTARQLNGPEVGDLVCAVQHPFLGVCVVFEVEPPDYVGIYRFHLRSIDGDPAKSVWQPQMNLRLWCEPFDEDPEPDSDK